MTYENKRGETEDGIKENWEILSLGTQENNDFGDMIIIKPLLL